MKKRAVFLDRDGTINIDKDYLFRIEDFEFLPGSLKALRVLQEAGYLLIIITNQSGIARGFFEEEDYQKLNRWMLNELETQGIKISGVYYCPHHPEAKIEKYRIRCTCRKPGTGNFLKAIQEFDIDPDSSFAIGDKIRDLSICEKTNCKGYLIGQNERAEIIEEAKAGKIKNVKYKECITDSAEEIVNADRGAL